MLRTRILTAAVALPLAVAGILLLPTVVVAALFGVLLAVAVWEWSGLLALSSTTARAVVVAVGVAVMAVCWYPGWRAEIIAVLLPLAACWWLAAIALIGRFPRVWDMSVAWPGLGAALGLLVVAAPFAGLVSLHAGAGGGPSVLLLFVLIWGADSGAYFAGRAWGRHKLAEHVSPGKTREGAFGGLALGLLAAGLGGALLGYTAGRLWLFVLLGGVTVVFSVVGDLAISMFKRQAGVKDSGSLFPGHGGVLDRLDSLCAAAPIYVIGVQLLAP